MTMIERVARAIAVARGHDPDETLYSCTDISTRPRWAKHEDDARAAIEAMREPTDAMVDAGFLSTDAFMVEGPEGVAKVWKAMIQAALEGEG